MSKIYEPRLINEVSKETGVSFIEVEKAIKQYHKVIANLIASDTEHVIDIKHVGYLMSYRGLKKNGTTNSNAGRDSDL